MKQEGLVTNTLRFWSSLDPLGKRVIAITLCFVGLPVAIVCNKLGFHGFAELLLLLVGTLFCWASGFFYLFFEFLKLVLRGITIIP